MSNQLQKTAPAWHDEAKQIIASSFLKDHALFLDSTKRATWWGLFFNHIKFRGDKKTGDGSIPHGGFGPWLKNNAPKEITWPLANTYMRLANGVCEKGKFQIVDFLQFAKTGELPPQVAKMVEGKSQQQLFWEFKNVDADGNPLKPGCKPGKRGAAKDSDDDDETDFIDGVRADIADLCDEDDDSLAKYPAAKRDKLEIALRALLQRILEIKRTASAG